MIPEWLKKFIEEVKEVYGVEPREVFETGFFGPVYCPTYVLVYDVDWDTWGKIARFKASFCRYPEKVMIVGKMVDMSDIADT